MSIVIAASIGTVITFNVMSSDGSSKERGKNIGSPPSSVAKGPTSSPSEVPSPSPSKVSPSPTASLEGWRGSVPIAKKFVSAYNNAIGYENSSPFSWVKKLKPFMTASGYREMEKLNVPPDPEKYKSGSPAYQTAHEMKVNVLSETKCVAHAEAEKPTSSKVLLSCSYKLYTIDDNGDQIPSETMPDTWVYGSGNEGNINLSMVKESGKWKASGIEAAV